MVSPYFFLPKKPDDLFSHRLLESDDLFSRRLDLTIRSELSIVPVVPWQPPAARGPPINCQFFTTLC